jgi:DNA repair photolyase
MTKAESKFKKIAMPKKPGFTAPVRGRGALDNPSGRFERLDLDMEPETYDALLESGHEELEQQIRTEVFKDTARSVISLNDSPDLHMEASLNAYRGCEHGCIYCYARPGHEYFGLSAGLDFESKIFVKPDAAKILAEQLSAKSWEPKVIMLSGVTDCYQPLEKKMKLTQSCLKVLRDFRNPGVIVTKNALVTRDIEVFQEMAAYDCISVNLSVTTLDGKLARLMEPRASQPAQRLRAIEALAKANVPVGIMMGPIVPGLTEHEIPSLLKAVSDAGARSAGYTMMRLPYGVKDLFQSWAAKHYPDRAEKILNRLREMHNGKLYDSNWGTRRRGQGVHAEHVAAMFALYRKKYKLDRGRSLSTAHFNRDAHSAQLKLL